MADHFPKGIEDIDTAVSKPNISKASPRPKSAAKKRGKKGASSKSSPYKHFTSASASQSSKTARDLWLQAVKGGAVPGSKKAHIGKRTPTEFWTDTLRRTGYGITPETLNHQSLTGLKHQDMSYKSTSHFLRQVAGTEKMSKTLPSDGSGKSSAGRPAYKSQEEYYDEVLALKKQIQQMNSESSMMKLKMRRLEEDNLKKEREIEQLLDPSKSEEMRRTLTDKRPDTGTVIHSMKQKILKLEQNLKEREAAYSKLQSDLKTTKIDEMKIQMEAYYREITRLNSAAPAVSKTSASAVASAPVKETPSKLRALQQTIMRMNEKNVRLTNENKSLKTDLQKVLEDRATHSDKKKEYEDMSKKELMGAIAKLEKRLDRAEGDSLSILSDVDGRRDQVEGKIVLEGSVAQRLDQLDRRETELLEELTKQKALVKRLKDDRTHYRKKCDEKEREIKLLRKDIDELQAEIDGFYDKDKNPTPRVTPRRKSTSSRRTSHSSAASVASDREQQKRIENFRQNHAAKQIQKGWRGHQHRKEEEERLHQEQAAQELRVREFQEAHAAKAIQKSWRAHNQAEREEACEMIQSAMRGHRTRLMNMNRMRGYMAESDVLSGVSDSELDDATDQIQSSMRGHMHRKSQIKSRDSSPFYGSPRTRSPASKQLLDSAGEELDSDEVKSVPSSRSRGSVSGRSVGSKASSRPRSASVKKSRTPPPVDSDDDDDDDDDIVVTSSHKKLF